MLELMKDLEILGESCEEDYKKKEYSSYERYLYEYNIILNSLIELGLETNLRPISLVPDGEKSSYGIGSYAEIAKHREILTESKKLLHRIGAIYGSDDKKQDAEKIIDLLLSKFHLVSRQLRDRYNNRATLDVKDEYDVQDVLHALLKIFFDDIRPEETTPSYAGGAKRMDFLLKSEKIVIEVKKTRDSLTVKDVGEQLLIDIASYREHPDCSTLICFVYDPEGRIGNPIGLENDLDKQSSDSLKVRTYIFPK